MQNIILSVGEYIYMTGWLVVNHFIKSDKFLEIFEWLQNATKKKNINLIKKTNVELMCGLYENYDSYDCSYRPDFILFWDKDIRLARFLEEKGFRLFNSASAIEMCDDKSLTYINLLKSGIKMPQTIIGPKIFRSIDYKNEEFIDRIIKKLGFPLIVKECFGSFGLQVYMAENKDKLINLLKILDTKPILFQKFINSSTGRDIRIHIVGGKMVAAMYRFNENDFRANITNGGKMKKYIPDNAQVELAVKVCNNLKLDFAGVDILIGEKNEPILCEVNSNAHFKNIFDCTGINVAEHIIKHIEEKISWN
ncbi:RimK family alpha-L-glutamate ligase [Herbivorax sp. ANBcel31]|uniref:ATP-grasp domain-containing protein n=1 Tax=Herbivorax sp. ANBcel31 TaxID=3069754 RepID=UPI0027B61DF6|nr:RimK family alpha-L-glutamate ligase [Herbivorax sp. ANBcel31]MDQ2087013.1 RimK family alpha-L-glutamate ligase [Herbivorax sp. ANBcel31]